MKTLALTLLCLLSGCADQASPPPPAMPKTEVAKTSAPETVAATDSQKTPHYPARIFALSSLQRADMKVNGHTIHVWVMDTLEKHTEGMMWLTDKDVKNDEGMIFVFDVPQQQSFWMENTVLPLDIGYIGPNKKLLIAVHGKPFDETSLPSKGDALYVLEMKSGSFERLGIKPGSLFTIPPGLKFKK